MSDIVKLVTADTLNQLLSAGTNITLTIVGDTLQISSTGGGGSLTSYYSEQEAETTNATIAYVNKTTLTQVLAAGDYLIQWSYQAKNNTAARGFYVAMNVDGVDINVSNELQSRATAPIDYIISGGMRRMTMTAASHTFIIRFKCAAAGNITTIKNARISILKLT